MKITIYTITDCAFSKQEKEYLSSHGLQFEEKNLETNREFLTEMLAVGSNFAGTPVTKIEKDDGQIVVLKGFTPAEFDTALGFAAVPAKPVAEPVAEPVVPVAIPVEQPAAPITAPVVEPVAPAPVSEVPPTIVEDSAMTSVLDTLEQKAQDVVPAEAAPQMPVAPVAGQPIIPDPQF